MNRKVGRVTPCAPEAGNREAARRGLTRPTKRTGSWFCCAMSVAAAFLVVVPAAPAQNIPRLGYIYPAGGREGATFQVTLGGQFLNGATNAYVSGTGIRAAVIEYNRPLTQNEFTSLRDKFRELQDKKRAANQSARQGVGRTGAQSSTNVWTIGDENAMAEIRNKLLKNPPNRQGNPAIAETVILQVSMAPDAEPGDREIRLGTPNGLSNPLLFRVGQLPEFSRLPAKVIPPELNFLRQVRPGNPQPAPPSRPEVRVTLPAVVNGQIMPGGVDRYRFPARKGQRLVIAVSARELMPYLADAVPGWFQAALSLYDAKGHELAYADHFRFHPDPILFYEVIRDGEYVIEIRDSIYRGREDFVYRITAGELPFVTGIFPPGGQAGAETDVELTGWNLPVSTLALTNDAPGIHPVSVRGEKWISNPVPFAVDTLPECREQEPNDFPAIAQAITLPVIVNGRIDRPGDWDVFRFAGRAGEEIVAEVMARRLGSPLDSVLKLTDAGGRQLAFNDDHEDLSAGLETHHADSYLRATLPADGIYFLHLGDTQQQGGPEHAYRLRLSEPQPDFALRVAPSSLNVRGGLSVPVKVYALRKDGFTNAIELRLKDAPAGFTLSGGKIPANQDQVRVTLTAPPLPLNEPVNLNLEGRATIQGHEAVRPCVPVEDMEQAFAYHHLVPVKELRVAVSGRLMGRNALRILGETPVKILAGGTAKVRIATPIAFADRFDLELNTPPEGITIQDVTPSQAGIEILLRSDAAKAKPGLAGNLIVNIFPRQTQAPSPRGRPQGNQRRGSPGTLPAIPFEIVAQ